MTTITLPRAVVEQALEALVSESSLSAVAMQRRMDSIIALRAALAQQAEPAEPVAWLFTNLQSGDYDFCYQEDEHNHDREMWHKQPLYTAPPQQAEPVQSTKLKIYPPNPSGDTMCIVKWLVETPHGWAGSWDKAALEYLCNSKNYE